MSDLVELLQKQAKEIAGEDHCGWGNTMLMAAERISQLESKQAALFDGFAVYEYLEKQVSPEVISKVLDAVVALGKAEVGR